MRKRAVVILALVLSIALVTLLAAPALATPPVEKKVPVKVTFETTKRTLVENRTVSGNVSHIVFTFNWKVFLTIGDSVTPIQGTGAVVRDTLYRYWKPEGVDQIAYDSYVFSFPNGGGFEGHAHTVLTDYVKVGNTVTYSVIVHVLLHGTGAYEGQMLNAWQVGPGTVPLWEGYLLKP